MVYDSLNVLGIMSGTSCDGLDLCLANFCYSNDDYKYQIIKAVTITFPNQLKKSLQNSTQLSGIDLIKLNKEWSDFASKQINIHFLSLDFKIDLISSHGHTVFHDPYKGINYQLGSLDVLCANTKVDVVGDFRSLDIANGGQGAPLVPYGDEKLFNEYDVCINLGGFANLSYSVNNSRKAFDICPCNLVLNHFASKLGADYDFGGGIASKGVLIPDLLSDLNNLPYYQKENSKSLGIEQLENEIFPLFLRYENTLKDIPNIMHTFVHHIVVQIKKVIPLDKKTILFSGGGVYNDFLMQLLKSKLNDKSIIIPDQVLLTLKKHLFLGF